MAYCLAFLSLSNTLLSRFGAADSVRRSLVRLFSWKSAMSAPRVFQIDEQPLRMRMENFRCLRLCASLDVGQTHLCQLMRRLECHTGYAYSKNWSDNANSTFTKTNQARDTRHILCHISEVCDVCVCVPVNTEQYQQQN